MQKKSTIKQNILLYLDFIGITAYKFYQDTGITRGILTQDNGMSEENTAKFLAYYPQINPEWLLTGKGDMLKKNIDDFSISLHEPGELYESINKEDKGYPLINATAIGGTGNAVFGFTDRDVKAYYKIPKFSHKKVDFMIEVEGSSMYPKYNSGDVVACTVINENSFIQWNKAHVIATQDQGIIIKRIKKSLIEDCLCMISDNPSYDAFEVPKSEINGIALVVGVIRLE
jgi:repressor LexA